MLLDDGFHSAASSGGVAAVAVASAEPCAYKVRMHIDTICGRLNHCNNRAFIVGLRVSNPGLCVCLCFVFCV